MKRKEIGIGIIGGGFMGKAHAVAMRSAGSIFETKLFPRLEMVSASNEANAQKYKEKFGFNTHAKHWSDLVNNPNVEAIIIASPPETHLEIVKLCFSLNKPVLCEKPLGASLKEALLMNELAQKTQITNMVGFNYILTPATQYAQKIIQSGELGKIISFKGEHQEDFLADPNTPSNWRTENQYCGTLDDLAPHIINCMLIFMGGISKITADVSTIYNSRLGKNGESRKVKSDDIVQALCHFKNGATGQIFASRVATGRKMGLTYEITCEKGAIKFDQEDQNSLYLYKTEHTSQQQGFTRIITGPQHPDYLEFCQAGGHGTGYQDQIIIEAKNFLEAIASNQPGSPNFNDGYEVAKVIDGIRQSAQIGKWISI